MKKIIMLVVAAIFAQGYALAQCNVSSTVKNGKFDVVFPKDRLYNGDKKSAAVKLSEKVVEVAEIKFPVTLGEIKNRKDIISCDGIALLPGSAKITEIKVISLQNLPPGATYKFDQADKTYPGGSVGCLTVSGAPTKKGVYNLKIQVEGKGNLMGVSKTVKCQLNNFKIYVL